MGVKALSEEVKRQMRDSAEDRLDVASDLGPEYRISNQICNFYEKVTSGGVYAWVDSGYAREDIDDLILLTSKGDGEKFFLLNAFLKRVREQMPSDDGEEQEEQCYCGNDDRCETCGGAGTYLRDVYEEALEGFQETSREFDQDFASFNLDESFLDSLLEKR
jgi:hypothetical protein